MAAADTRAGIPVVTAAARGFLERPARRRDATASARDERAHSRQGAPVLTERPRARALVRGDRYPLRMKPVSARRGSGMPAGDVVLTRSERARWSFEVDATNEELARQIEEGVRRDSQTEREIAHVRRAARYRRKWFGPKGELRPSWRAFLRGWYELWWAVELREGFERHHVTAESSKTFCGDPVFEPTAHLVAEMQKIRFWCGRCRNIARTRGLAVVDEFESVAETFREVDRCTE